MPRVTRDPEVKRFDVLGQAECLDCLRRIESLQGSWIQRGPAFFTLGAAAYLDACGAKSAEAYRAKLQESNPVLLSAFYNELERVREIIEELVDAPCRYATELAAPGFHIFLKGSLSAVLRDNLHVDLQYTYLSIDADLFTPTLTFTLPVVLPDAGAGIEFCTLDGSSPRGTLSTEQYRLGELLVHSGRALHRRAHFPVTRACRRITLQGHAIRQHSHWVLYW
jgi:hypothetical protein